MSELADRLEQQLGGLKDLEAEGLPAFRSSLSAATLIEIIAALRAQKPSKPAASFCPQCGFNVECDEDGCCATCGATAMGEAVKALRVFSAQWRQAPTEEADE